MVDLTGAWEGTYWQDNQPVPFTAEFMQTEESLTGTIVDDAGRAQATIAGTVRDRQVEFTKRYVTQKTAILYSGTVADTDSALAGHWHFETVNSSIARTNRWQAQRQPQPSQFRAKFSQTSSAQTLQSLFFQAVSTLVFVSVINGAIASSVGIGFAQFAPSLVAIASLIWLAMLGLLTNRVGFGWALLSLGILPAEAPRQLSPTLDRRCVESIRRSAIVPLLAIILGIYGLGLLTLPLPLTVLAVLLILPLFGLLNLDPQKLNMAIWFPLLALPIPLAIVFIPGLIRSPVWLQHHAYGWQGFLVILGLSLLMVLGAGAVRLISASYQNSQQAKPSKQWKNPRVCIFVRVINPKNPSCTANNPAMNAQQGILQSYANRQGYKLDRIQYTVDAGAAAATPEEAANYNQAMNDLLRSPGYHIFLIEHPDILDRFGFEQAQQILQEQGRMLEVYNAEIGVRRSRDRTGWGQLAMWTQVSIVSVGLVLGWAIVSLQ